MHREVAIGDVLDGRFRITGILREGAMAKVFDAIDLGSQQAVAIKVPHPWNERHPIYSARFNEEEKIGISLDHPGVLRILPVERKSRPYIVMERLDGAPLSDLLKRGQPLPQDEALQIGIRLALALEYMHSQQVIHRDLKPGNIMICRDGNLRVMDLGLALAQGKPVYRPLGVQPAIGTPDYMPPEHVRGEAGDQRSDVYSVGVILFEMLTGYAPYQGSVPSVVMNARLVGDPLAPRSLRPEISPELEDILLHALELRPEERYSSMAELRKALQSPESVIPAGRAQRLKPPRAWVIQWLRARSFVWTMLVFLGLVGIFMLVVTLSGGLRPHHR